MAEKKTENSSGGSQILAGYGWQVFFVLVLATSLFGIFYWFFGFDRDLLWTNIVVLAIWLILLLLSLLIPPIGEFWRVNKWIMGSSVLILLFLFDSSWAQSALSTSSQEKNIVESIPVDTHLDLQAEYPSQILYDGSGKVEIRLLTTGSFENLKQRKIIISSSGNTLLFAVKPSSDVPIAWSDSLEFDLSENANAITLLAQPAEHAHLNTLSTKLTLKADGLDLVTSKGNELRIEGKHDLQIRAWKKIFLGTSSLIVALIGTVFAGIKQWDEEEKRKKAAKEDDEKRQRAAEIEQFIGTFNDEVRNNLSGALERAIEFVRDCGQWEKSIQIKFVKKTTEFLDSEKFWGGLLDKDIAELTTIVGQFLKLYKLIQPEKVAIPEQLNLLSKSLQQDALNLLTLLKDYPQSIFVTKKIANTLPDEVKKKIPEDYKNKFFQQIIDLGFLNSESYPLQGEFSYYSKEHPSDDKLTKWLNTHRLDYSPFADADNPFYSVSNKNLLIDLATSGFTASSSSPRNITFGFANSWDAGAALFDYCKALQLNIKIKEDVFFVVFSPSIVENCGTNHTQKILLHALAEQWIWSFSEIPTLFYSLMEPQRTLLCRLLRWHDLSPSITASKVMERFQSKQEEKGTRALPLKIKEWLNGADSTDLRMEEINALIELRPPPKKLTFFLVSNVDLNPHIEKQITHKLHEKLDKKSGWLSAHGCMLVHFLLDDKSRQTLPQSSLITQCKIRIQKCSKNMVDAFDLLFVPHDQESADSILAKKANGSPGEMVRLGQKLLQQHVEKYSRDTDLHIEDLIALK